MIFVKDILSKKTHAFNHVSPATSVLEALHMMRSLNVSYVIVTADWEYRGLFCETDYARKLVLCGLRSHNTEVQAVMRVDIPVVSPHHTINDCKKILESHNTRYLLVFDISDQFIGVVTSDDVLHHIHAEADEFPAPNHHTVIFDTYF